MKDHNQFLLRSMMFVSGHNQRLIDSAVRSSADCLILDLEDSVQPSSQKQVARDTIKANIESGRLDDYITLPRVNDRESGHLLRDVHQLTIPGIDGFVYPKSHTGQDVYFFDKLLETIEAEKGIPFGTFKIVPLIETAAAVMNAQAIIQASDRVIAIAFGCEDFLGDLGGIHDAEGLSIYPPRSLVAMAAKANGVAAIDTVHINVHDLEDLEKNLQLAKKLGFNGMLSLHPKELDLIHQYFSPSQQEVDDAREMLALFEEAQSNNRGVAMKNGKFIGPPFAATARKVLRRHELIEKYSK